MMQLLHVNLLNNLSVLWKDTKIDVLVHMNYVEEKKISAPLHRFYPFRFFTYILTVFEVMFVFSVESLYPSLLHTTSKFSRLGLHDAVF